MPACAPFISASALKPQRCGNSYCHEKAVCHNDLCYCKFGYVGNGVTVCTKTEEGEHFNSFTFKANAYLFVACNVTVPLHYC